MYFIATRLLRDGGAGPTILVSPLPALMRNQIRMAERAGVVARTMNSENRDHWEEVTSAISRDEVDPLRVSPGGSAIDARGASSKPSPNPIVVVVDAVVAGAFGHLVSALGSLTPRSRVHR